MKVLYLVSGISPSAGWGSEYIQDLIIEVAKKGVDVTIISPIYSNTAKNWQQWISQLQKKHHIKIIALEAPPWIKNNRLLHFLLTPFIVTTSALKLLLKQRFDLIHEFSSVPVILPRDLIFHLIFKTPVVFSWSVYNHLLIGQPIWFKLFNFAKAYIVYAKELEEKLTNLGINRKKIYFMLPNIKDLFLTKKLTPAQARKKLNLPEEKFIYSYFGSLSKEKGVFDLISAVKNLDPDFKNKVLFIFAISSLKDASKLAEKLRGESAVKTIPGLTDIKTLIEASNVVILPQQTGHGTTIPAVSLLEAARLNKPVIATVIIGNLELKNLVEGIFIPAQNPQALTEAIEKSYIKFKQSSYVSKLQIPSASEAALKVMQIYQIILK